MVHHLVMKSRGIKMELPCNRDMSALELIRPSYDLLSEIHCLTLLEKIWPVSKLLGSTSSRILQLVCSYSDVSAAVWPVPD